MDIAVPVQGKLGLFSGVPEDAGSILFFHYIHFSVTAVSGDLLETFAGVGAAAVDAVYSGGEVGTEIYHYY